MARKLRFGFIGMGNINRTQHLRVLREIPDVECVALAEVDQKTADLKGDLVGIPLSFGDHREMFRNVELDAVVVGSPNHLHCPHTIDALKAGCHVMVEKPIGLNTAEVKRMIAAGKRARKIAMAALCYRFQPQVQAARELADAGVLGNVYHARVEIIRRRGIPGLGNWWTTKACGGGALADIGVHVADTVLYVAGLPMPTHASSALYRKFGHRKDYAYTGMWGTPVPGGPMDVEDYASGFIRFGSKMTMTVEVAWAAEAKSGIRMEVLGDRGGFLIDEANNAPQPLILFNQRGDKLVEESVAVRRGDRYALQARHFVDCIRTNAKPVSDLTTTLPVQALLDGMHKSSKAGREIRI